MQRRDSWLRAKPGRPSRLEAGPAVHGAIGGRFERDRRLLPARRAHDLEHLPIPAPLRPCAGPARPLGRLAGFAALGCVLEALLGVKFLFPSREHEGLATIHTRQRLVLERHAKSSLVNDSVTSRPICVPVVWLGHPPVMGKRNWARCPDREKARRPHAGGDSPARRYVPLRPPALYTRRTSPMTMRLSTALHIS